MIEKTAGIWLVECSELLGFGQRENEAIKAMISRQRDRARQAYARSAKDVPRQFVLFGTTNDRHYLRNDPSGHRRFWPVTVAKVDLEALATDRDQLLAEAAYYEARGESVELPPSLYEAIRREHESRRESEPRLEKLEPLLADKIGSVKVEDVWSFLEIKGDRQSSSNGRRVKQVMEQLGFRKVRMRLRGDERPYVFTNGTTPEEIATLITLPPPS